MVWGLAKASGRPLPCIIDTPLGRLDSEHRHLLLENYYPFASHQVILLSTDKEVDHHYLETINAHVGRIYQLCYDDVLGATMVHEGYFEEAVLAN
jgi:DNA sulfur modification protein DndD